MHACMYVCIEKDCTYLLNVRLGIVVHTFIHTYKLAYIHTYKKEDVFMSLACEMPAFKVL